MVGGDAVAAVEELELRAAVDGVGLKGRAAGFLAVGAVAEDRGEGRAGQNVLDCAAEAGAVLLFLWCGGGRGGEIGWRF